MLRGAVSLGVTGLSPFAAFCFFDLGVGFGRGLASFLRGELEAAAPRPLRVVLRSSSSSIVDLGVGGEKSGCSCYTRSAFMLTTTTRSLLTGIPLYCPSW
jgi:hypothetical protein